MTNFTKDVHDVFEAPADILEDTIKIVGREEKAILHEKPLKLAEDYFNTLGPGLVTGAADDDPSGIAVYSQTGATYGFQLLWLMLFTFPFMAIIQEMCARIGVVTGRGLAANIRSHYSSRVLYGVAALLFIANTFNIAADLGAMAASTRLLVPHLNFLLLVSGFALLMMLVQIFTSYARYAKILKWLTLALFAYVVTAFMIGLDWSGVLYHTVVPTVTLSQNQLFLICAILGTTISPYLFFWQTSQEAEEQHYTENKITKAVHAEPHETIVKKNIRKMRIDVWSGMFFSNAISFFIMATCAATLYAHGITNIATADQAALAIRPFGGVFTYFLFAVGIVGTGLLAVPVLAGSSAYAIAESFRWREGLRYTLTQARAFYGVIIISMLVAILANVAGLDPIKGLIYAAVANGLVAPIVIFFILRLSGRMKRYGNHPFVTVLGWLVLLLMSVSGLAAIISLFIV